MTAPGPILFAGHFPPPVHGMAACMAAIADATEARTPIVRLRTSPDSMSRGGVEHLRRVGRVLAASGSLVVRRRRSRTLFLTIDAGFGMVYPITLAVVGRALRYRVVVQHHSCAYFDHPFLLGRVLAFVVGRGTHIVSCDGMEASLRKRYRRARDVRVLPVSYAVQRAEPGPGRPTEGHGIRIGHLANLSVEKGLREVIELGEALLAVDPTAELVLGGPCTGPEEEALVARAVAMGGGRIRHVGPVHGADRDAFYDSLDAFVFPSQYRHESFGLVIWEVMQRAVPAVALPAGCLQQEQVGGGGLVVDDPADFVPRVLELFASWRDDPTAQRRMAEEARRVALELFAVSEVALDRTIDDLIAG